MSHRRIAFGILNLPLSQQLEAGPFILNPVSSGQEELSKRSSMNTDPVVSAEGQVDVPSDSADGWDYFHTLPIGQMEILLSFAERRFVEICSPRRQHYEENEWVNRGWHFHQATIGDPTGVSWHHGHDHLQKYLTRSLPILTD